MSDELGIKSGDIVRVIKGLEANCYKHKLLKVLSEPLFLSGQWYVRTGEGFFLVSNLEKTAPAVINKEFERAFLN